VKLFKQDVVLKVESYNLENTSHVLYKCVFVFFIVLNEAVAVCRLLSSGTLRVVSYNMKTDAGIFSETLVLATLCTASHARGL
jgi:hypothetical protein